MIVVVGSLNMDAIARVARLPMPGETVLATGFTQTLGGKGANQAVAAARGGSTVAFIGRVGRDAAGEALLAGLGEAGVNTESILHDAGGSSGMALISVDHRAENTIVVVPGVNAHVCVDDIEAAADLIARSDILLLQLEVPLAAVTRAAELAQRAGTTVILNPSPAQELPVSLLRLVDILVPNAEEVGYLSGMGSPVDPESAAGMLRANGAKSVVITLGDRGASVITDDGEMEVPAYEVDALDTTGAGDAFVGNLAASLDSGLSLLEAAEFASAAAALSVRSTGAQSSMPRRDQTLEFIARTGDQ